MPNHIEFDVNEMVIGDSVHVRDLVLPAGVETLTDGDTTVCVCAAPRAVIEETPAPAAETAVEPAAEPEVIRKAKTDEESEDEET
jgi:large subunit ribosomal protein L25